MNENQSFAAIGSWLVGHQEKTRWHKHPHDDAWLGPDRRVFPFLKKAHRSSPRHNQTRGPAKISQNVLPTKGPQRYYNNASLWPLRCALRTRRAPSTDAGRPTRQPPARTSGTSPGSCILESQLIFRLRGRGIQPRPMIPSRLSFPAIFSCGYRRLRNIGFVKSTRSEITRRTEKEPVFIRSMTA
jgi:hypothetical protein